MIKRKSHNQESYLFQPAFNQTVIESHNYIYRGASFSQFSLMWNYVINVKKFDD